MQKDIETNRNDRHAAENAELRALLRELSEYLDKSPDRAVRHGSLFHHAVREACKPALE
jgi:hypothetical protein